MSYWRECVPNSTTVWRRWSKSLLMVSRRMPLPKTPQRVGQPRRRASTISRWRRRAPNSKRPKHST